MPKALFRHGAVVVPKNNSEYVFVLGGLQGANSQDTVYYSDVPNTPTATPTSTPTAAPVLSISIDNVACLLYTSLQYD